MKASALVVSLLAAYAWASETPVKLKDLPEPVRKTAQEQSKGATVHGYAKEIESGKTYYEVETKVNGKSRDILIDPTGAVVEIEEEVALDSIPPAARAAFEKAGKVISVETVTKGSAVAYEAKVSKGGKKTEIKVSAGGQLIKD